MEKMTKENKFVMMKKEKFFNLQSFDLEVNHKLQEKVCNNQWS